MIIHLFSIIRLQNSIKILIYRDVVCVVKVFIHPTAFVIVLNADILHQPIALYQQEIMFFCYIKRLYSLK